MVKANLKMPVKLEINFEVIKSLQENDLLIVRIPPNIFPDAVTSFMRKVKTVIDGAGFNKIGILGIMGKDVTLEKLTEKQMNQLGWYKK